MEIHMPPYYNSMDLRVSTVMISYSSINGKKMHANHDLVTGFLKKILGFRVRNLTPKKQSEVESVL